MLLPENRGTCFTAINGTKVFAVINIIKITAGTVIVVGLLLYWAAILVLDIKSDKFNQDEFISPLMYTIMSGVSLLSLLMFLLVALLFASFLVNGVFKNKPAHIKAYYIYGVIVNILAVLAAVGFALITLGDELPVFYITLFVCLIYTFVLVMIRRAYKKMENIQQQYTHQQLIEANCVKC